MSVYFNFPLSFIPFFLNARMCNAQIYHGVILFIIFFMVMLHFYKTCKYFSVAICVDLYNKE